MGKAWGLILIGKRVGWYTRIVMLPLSITGKKLEIMKLLGRMQSKLCRVTRISFLKQSQSRSIKILVRNR